MRVVKTQPIVEIRNFVLATRDTGYRSTAAAVAELVDNAIQAEAKHIRVVVGDVGNGGDRQVAVAVLDDGCGMEPAILRTALQFGGSDRFNRRTGMGRFGMGLPNSSLSQCRRVEVFSWQQRRKVFRSYLDVDEIAAGEMAAVPTPTLAVLPHWVRNLAAESGTLVIWTKCDRLENRRASTIARKLLGPLGRRFRNFIWRGVKVEVNDTPVEAVDPMFSHSTSNALCGAELFAPMEYRMRLPHDVESASTITVRFALLPVEEWYHLPNEEKRSRGISGGAGVSVMRAGREVAYGWYFMGRRRKQNYDDWWRCEVAFEPELDEWFGVTHSKQDINPVPELELMLSPDIVAMANRLNNIVRETFLQIRSAVATYAAERATVVEWLLPSLRPVLAGSAPNAGYRHHNTRIGYNIHIEARSEVDFLIWQVKDGALHLTINENHPFFTKMYLPLQQNGDPAALYYLECMLLAYARSEALRDEASERAWAAQLRQDWSNALAAMLS